MAISDDRAIDCGPDSRIGVGDLRELLLGVESSQQAGIGAVLDDSNILLGQVVGIRVGVDGVTLKKEVCRVRLRLRGEGVASDVRKGISRGDK
ncbi:hypothetical protein BGX23_009221 [Mortierella sp. AD031]|nr:hypothetical protein BGX23_009221 [Mortierella sp. AD031]